MNTLYLRNMVAGNLFQTKTTPTLPSAMYIGLSSTAPSEDGTGVTEPSTSAGYARVKLTTLSEPSDGTVTNTSAIEFTESTAAWGTMTYFVVYDALTSGNLLMYGALSASRTVEAETIMTIKTGGLTLSVVNPD